MTTPQTFNIKGMHCASCAAIIEKTLKKVDGVHDVAVNYGTETAKIDFDEAKTNPHHLSQTIEPLGYTIAAAHAPTAASMGMSEDEHAAHLGLNQSKREKLAEVAGMRRLPMGALPLAAIAAAGMLFDIAVRFALAPESATLASALGFFTPLGHAHRHRHLG